MFIEGQEEGGEEAGNKEGGDIEKEENKEPEANETKKQKKVKKAAEVGGVNTLEANPDNISLKVKITPKEISLKKKFEQIQCNFQL